MKINKKDLITTGVAVTLALAVLIGGGTYSYLQGQTDDVTNTFETNKVNVKLNETTGNEYNIIPGTTQKKDPKVTVDNSVDSYVYVEVTDNTDGLVDYEIVDEWTPLWGYNNVYYRVVKKDANPQVFSILKDDKVTYDTSLTNTDMVNKDGTLKDGIKLTFKAYAIQYEPFKDAIIAYKVINAEKINDADGLKEALDNGTPVSLDKDITLDDNDSNEQAIIDSLSNSTIDLNGKTLNIENMKSGIVVNGSEMTIVNGTIKCSGEENTTMIALKSDGKVSFENVNIETNATINVEAGTDPARLDIIDSKIYSTDYYCVSTNAANNETGENVNINIKNSELIVKEQNDSNHDCTAILFNVPGKLNVENSNLEAERQAVIVRCGTANIRNSTLTTTAECRNDWHGKYDSNTWGSGNEVPVATLVVGNRSGASAYPYDATCILENTTLNIPSEKGKPQIYVAAYNGHNSLIVSDNQGYNIEKDCDTANGSIITVRN